MKNKFFTGKFVPAAQIRRLWKGMVITVKNKFFTGKFVLASKFTG